MAPTKKMMISKKVWSEVERKMVRVYEETNTTLFWCRSAQRYVYIPGASEEAN